MVVKILFCCIYACFTAPLIKNLYVEITECTPAAAMSQHLNSDVSEVLDPHLSPVYTTCVFVLWMSVLTCVYGTIRAVGEHVKGRAQNPHALFKYHRRNTAQHRTDYLFIVLIFGVLFYPRILQPFVLNAPFVWWFLYFFVIYSALFETCEAMTKLTLTAKLLSNPVGLAIVIISSGIITGFVYHHMVCAVVDTHGFWFHRDFWGGTVLQALLFFFPSDDMKLHIHHYYWPLSFLQLCVFANSKVSQITAAMLCAISMHGICFFGVQPLMYHKEVATTTTTTTRCSANNIKDTTSSSCSNSNSSNSSSSSSCDTSAPGSSDSISSMDNFNDYKKSK